MKVSVAMITYNHEHYIREALDGILMQETNFDFNIVIGEDASNDDTKSILQEYIHRFPNKIVCTFHESNIGMMPNFIYTLESCNGDYIALCEGDDYWIDKNKLQKQVDFLEANSNYVGCFHNVLALNQQNPSVKPKPWRDYNKDTFDLLDTFSKTALFHTCSFVFKREALSTPKWLNKVKSGDMALFSIVAQHGSLKLLEGNMSVYRKVETGVTSSLKEKDYHKSRLRLISYFKTYFNDYTFQLNLIEEYHNQELARLKMKQLKTFAKSLFKKNG